MPEPPKASGPHDESRVPVAQKVAPLRGWLSDLPTFYGTQPRVVRERLQEFIGHGNAIYSQQLTERNG